MKRIASTLILVVLGIVLVAPVVHATNSLFQLGGEKAPGIGSQKNTQLTLSECIQKGNCGVEHFFLLSNNIIRWVIGVAGAIALFMYIIGGVWMIFSAGSSTRIGRGKDILIGTTIALVFILTSWVLVSFVLQGLGTTSDYTLSGVSCGSTSDCSVSAPGKVCINNKCVDLCYSEKTLKETDPAKQWGCKQPTACSNGTPATVAGCGGAANCAPGLCADTTLVCCY